MPGVPSMYQFGLPPSVSCLVNGTSTTKNVFLWCRFQGGVHLSFVVNDVRINKILSDIFRLPSGSGGGGGRLGRRSPRTENDL